MGPTLGPSGADRTQVGPMLAPWTLLSGTLHELTNSSYFPHFCILSGRAWPWPPWSVSRVWCRSRRWRSLSHVWGWPDEPWSDPRPCSPAGCHHPGSPGCGLTGDPHSSTCPGGEEGAGSVRLTRYSDVTWLESEHGAHIMMSHESHGESNHWQLYCLFKNSWACLGQHMRKHQSS